MPPESFYQVWDLGAQSSGSRQTMAALNHFGLVEYVGRGEERKVKLTPLATYIVFDKQQQSPERDAKIRTAALMPAIHAELWKKYGALLPADVAIETYLTRDRGYNEKAAKSLLGEYKSTLKFAGLDKPDNIPSDVGEKSILEPPPIRDVAVGDLVQIEIDGAAQLEKPARVRAVQDHEGQKWVFVDGSETGIPMSQIIVQQTAKPAAAPLSTPPKLPLPIESGGPGLRPIESEREWLRGPLSRDTSYRLIVAGDLGPKELGKLIKLLEAQKNVLSDDDDDTKATP
jgi:hypothetical protein